VEIVQVFFWLALVIIPLKPRRIVSFRIQFNSLVRLAGSDIDLGSIFRSVWQSLADKGLSLLPKIFVILLIFRPPGDFSSPSPCLNPAMSASDQHMDAVAISFPVSSGSIPLDYCPICPLWISLPSSVCLDQF
jgi:hypothetical protein